MDAKVSNIKTFEWANNVDLPYLFLQSLNFLWSRYQRSRSSFRGKSMSRTLHDIVLATRNYAIGETILVIW